MAAPNVFQELKNVLTELKTFLDGPTVTTIQKAISTIAALVPQVNDVIDELTALLTKLDKAIADLSVGNVGLPDLEKVTQFTKSIKTLLETAKGVLPNEAAEIDKVLSGLDLVAGLPSIGDLKGEIHTLLTELIGKVSGFKG
jgi:ABC-type transporter Mla subunit MlaD